MVVREDLPTPHKAVQANHAVLEATKEYLKDISDHPNLVICTVPNQIELLKLGNYLYANGIKFCDFQEEDLNNEVTAFATKPLAKQDRKHFRKLKLLS